MLEPVISQRDIDEGVWFEDRNGERTQIERALALSEHGYKDGCRWVASDGSIYTPNGRYCYWSKVESSRYDLIRRIPNKEKEMSDDVRVFKVPAATRKVLALTRYDGKEVPRLIFPDGGGLIITGDDLCEVPKVVCVNLREWLEAWLKEMREGE